MITAYGCRHRPERLYTWTAPAIANRPEQGSVLCVVCCDCGQTWEKLQKSARKAA
jgi:hypothetical protein